MRSYIDFNFRQQHFLLTSSRCIFWEEEKILVVSDLHLGKSGHFRKSGIAIPQTVFKADMHRLLDEIQFFKPHQLLVIGDLFHSSFNKEHDLFLRWRKDIPGTSIQLVKGNHDILADAWYRDAGIDLHEGILTIGDMAFTHDIDLCDSHEDTYCFSGHVHPGIRMRGAGRQALQLPCFYFGKHYAILPAFGKFTGTSAIEPRAGDQVFALVEDKLMKIY